MTKGSVSREQPESLPALLARRETSLRAATRAQNDFSYLKLRLTPERNPYLEITDEANLDRFLRLAMYATGADCGNVQLFDSSVGALRLVTHSGFGCEFLEYFHTVKQEDRCACAGALRTSSRLIIPDVATHPAFSNSPAKSVLLRAGIRSVQSTPLVDFDGTLLGVVSTHHKHPQRHHWECSRGWRQLDDRCFDFLARTRAETQAFRDAMLRLNASHR